MGLLKNKAAKSSPSSFNTPANLNSRIIFVGASTGGAEAIRELLHSFPADTPPILIVQHMPELFTASFAARLDGICQARVVEAQDGDIVCHGTVYVAPGHSHMRIQHDPSGSAWAIALSKEPPFNHHRPSVDVLFNSAAKLLEKNAIGVILTGMGKDGARGLLAMREAGAHTFAQDEDSCVVYGMPREAAIIGAAEVVAALHDLPKKILNLFGKNVL